MLDDILNSMCMCYVLDEQGNPVVEPDLQKWGKWFHEHIDKRSLGMTILCVMMGVRFVSLPFSESDER